MPKTISKGVFKEGTEGKRFTQMDYTTPEGQQKIKELKAKQEEIMRRESVDWGKLSKYRMK